MPGTTHSWTSDSDHSVIKALDVASKGAMVVEAKVESNEKPFGNHGEDFNECVAAHQLKYPGGKLPTELRSLATFQQYKSGVPGFLCKL